MTDETGEGDSGRHPSEDAVTETRADPTRPRLPKQIGQFHIKDVLAYGGMGVVYRAVQEQPRRTVAVKLMKHGIASRSAMRRFEYESQVLGRLHHPGIAQVYDAGTHDDGSGPVPYFAMEYGINDHWSSKVGLRYEYTDSQLDTETDGNVVDRQYGKIFPTIFLNRKFSDLLNMNLSYAKRITRPTFSQMAPYVIMWDPDTFTLGNIEIQPAFSNSIKYDINYKSSIFSLMYSHEDSSIARFQITYDAVNDRIILRSENLDYTKIFSATFGAPLKISDWWRTQNNITYTKSNIRAFNSSDETFDLSSNSLRANSTSSFKFSNSLTIDIVSSYQGPRISGTSKVEDTFRMDIGLHKGFGDRWGSLKFGIVDLFDSYNYNSVTDIPEQKLEIVRNFRYSYRSFRLTYARNFGNRKVKSSRVRETGSEEERKRIH